MTCDPRRLYNYVPIFKDLEIFFNCFSDVILTLVVCEMHPNMKSIIKSHMTYLMKYY